MRMRRPQIEVLVTVIIGLLCAIGGLAGAAKAQVQPWGLPPLPPGVGPVEKFADVSQTPQGKFLEGGAFDSAPAELGQTCEPQGTRWHEGKLYLTTRHRGILVYDPQTKEVKTLVYTYRNQLFKGPNDLDFDAEGNLFFTDPWGTGPGPNTADRTGAIYQYSRDGVLRKVMDGGLFPNGIAVSPDNTVLAIGDFAAGRMWYALFTTGPTMGCPQCTKDPLHLTFAGVKAGTYFPGNGGPDGIHYDVKGNLWAALARLGGIVEIDPRGGSHGLDLNLLIGNRLPRRGEEDGRKLGIRWRFHRIRHGVCSHHEHAAGVHQRDPGQPLRVSRVLRAEGM